MQPWFYCWLYDNSSYPKLRNTLFRPHPDKVSPTVAVAWGLSTTPKQTAKAAVFFRSSTGFAQGMCERSLQVHPRVGSAAAQQSRARTGSSGASLSTRHLAFRKANSRNPFPWHRHSLKKLPLGWSWGISVPPSAHWRALCPSGWLREKAETQLGWATTSDFFVTVLFYREQTQHHVKRGMSAEPHLPMNGTCQ